MQESRLRRILRIMVIVSVSIALGLIIRSEILSIGAVPTSSMEPTLQPGDKFILSPIVYRLREPRRGDVVTFRLSRESLEDAGLLAPGQEQADSILLVKRIVGIPGDSLESRGDSIIVCDVNRDCSIDSGWGDLGTEVKPITLGAGQYYVVGDNRDESGDSRIFGPIAEDQLIAPALFLILPTDRFGKLD